MNQQSPQSEITIYADQFARLAAKVAEADLVDQEVITLAYYADGSVSVTAADTAFSVAVSCDVAEVEHVTEPEVSE